MLSPAMRNLFGPSLTAGGGVALGMWLESRKRHEDYSPVRNTGVVECEGNSLLKYGMPMGDSMLVRHGNLMACVDGRTRNPKWVLERISKDTLTGRADRESVPFKEDDQIPDPRFRSKLSDYVGSGYDRGHMVPAANHKHSQDAMEDTFKLSNICPQVGKGFNRDYWAYFERFLREVAKQPTVDNMYILTARNPI